MEEHSFQTTNQDYCSTPCAIYHRDIVDIYINNDENFSHQIEEESKANLGLGSNPASRRTI